MHFQWAAIFVEVDGIRDGMEVGIGLSDKVSGPPTGWRSAIERVAMSRATTEGQRGKRPLRGRKANSKGRWRNLAAAS